MKSFCFFFLLIAFVFSACNLRPKVEIAGVTAGVASGVVAINDDKGEMISAGRITNNQFKIDHIFIERSAFYTLELAPDEMKKRSYPVYLETGTYTVKFDQSKDYPVIKSTSQIQHEISTYYLIRDSLSHDKEQITVGSEPVVQQFNVAGNKGLSLDGKALDIFITRYPDNHIAAYLMSEMFYGNIPVAYKANPVPYYNLYKKLNAFNKATSEGRQIGKTLQHLVNVQPGKPAPDIAGLTPDGKRVDLKKMNTRFVLVEFWRASNAVSRINHKEMVLNPPNSTGGNLSIVSVSLDVKRDWWLTSAKDDKITWTQVSDLKGEDSPNVENWAVTDLPLYYLLDGNGRIISRDRGLFGVRKLLAEKSGTHPK